MDVQAIPFDQLIVDRSGPVEQGLDFVVVRWFAGRLDELDATHVPTEPSRHRFPAKASVEVRKNLRLHPGRVPDQIRGSNEGVMTDPPANKRGVKGDGYPLGLGASGIDHMGSTL